MNRNLEITINGQNTADLPSIKMVDDDGDIEIIENGAPSKSTVISIPNDIEFDEECKLEVARYSIIRKEENTKMVPAVSFKKCIFTKLAGSIYGNSTECSDRMCGF